MITYVYNHQSINKMSLYNISTIAKPDFPISSSEQRYSFSFLSLLVIIACFLVLATFTVTTSSAQENKTPEATIMALISDLSAPEFLVRQRAMNQLVAIGAEAIPGLNDAIRDGNRETRFRAGRVVDAVEQNVFQQKLEQFIKARVGDVNVTLPSWKMFCETIPETAESRRVFAQISRAEPRLCRSIEHGPGSTSKEIDRRCAEIQVAMRETRMADFSIGTINGLLFAAGMDAVKMNRYSVKTIFSLCNLATFAGQLRVRSSTGLYTYPTTANAKIMRTLFAGCLTQCESWDAQMAFTLAMNLRIPQCLPRALELVRDKETPCHVVQTVMIAIAMFGDKNDVSVLELRVDDKSFCGVTQRVNNVQYKTQLRDVAIVAMLVLLKENPKLYGFPRIQVYTSGQFSYSHVGFANDESRAETRAKWDALRSTLKVPRLGGQ